MTGGPSRARSHNPQLHIKRILLRQANDEACGAGECWRAAGLGPAENQDSYQNTCIRVQPQTTICQASTFSEPVGRRGTSASAPSRFGSQVAKSTFASR